MRIEKVKGEKGLKLVKVKTEKVKTEKVKSVKPKIDEKEKMIYEILKTFCVEKKDPDVEYMEKVEGRYEKYIRTYFPEVLEKKEYGKIWHKKENVIFYYKGKILAIKYIDVYRNGDEKRFNIGIYNFRLKQPETVEKKITFKNKEMEAKELYKAVIKLGAIMCDVKEMA